MKPILAAVEGFAVAGGTEILQGTDIRVAGEGAVFGVTEARRGLFPLGGSSVRLRRQIPYTLAAEILLTGGHVTAQEAPGWVAPCRLGAHSPEGFSITGSYRRSIHRLFALP